MQWQYAEVDDYAQLVCQDRPLLDVRAPVEFAKGAFPATRNIALLNDDERHQIGIHYKNHGHDAAVALGAKLIQGKAKQARIAQWLDYLERSPDVVLYCFRGGMRSQITQQWIYQASGKLVPRVKGGYKALRRFLIDQTEILAAQTEPMILSGRTGSGKTRLLKKLKCAIDLEHLANHRGSSIGRNLSPQPTQIHFENSVAIALLKKHQQGVTQLVFEDESPNIGSVHIPHALYHKMSDAPCVIVDTPLEKRVENILQEYVVDMLARYQQQVGDQERGFSAFSAYLSSSLSRVQRRLGGQRYQEIMAAMNGALAVQQQSGDTQAHREWLRRMLVEYYDPMYDYQRDKRRRVVVKQADFAAILDHLRPVYGKQDDAC